MKSTDFAIIIAEMRALKRSFDEYADGRGEEAPLIRRRMRNVEDAIFSMSEESARRAWESDAIIKSARVHEGAWICEVLFASSPSRPSFTASLIADHVDPKHLEDFARDELDSYERDELREYMGEGSSWAFSPDDESVISSEEDFFERDAILHPIEDDCDKENVPAN
jgi:hypothetical protein